MPLTHTAVANAKPREKVYRLSDGEGLFLQISPQGGKYWRLRYFFNGKENMLALGTYPEVSLADAREKRLAARKLVQAGKDPNQVKREQKEQAQDAAANTFHDIAKEWHTKNLNRWIPDHADKIWRRLEKHIFPDHGHRPVADIKPLEVLRTIQRIENEGHTEISHRVLQTCSAIFQYAFVLGKVEYNPAASLQNGVLKAHKATHYPTITAKELPAFLGQLEQVETTPVIRLAVRLLLHTFIRQGEMRQAKWDDIDWEAKEWRLPASITKMRTEHVVPLSRQSEAILRELQTLTGDNPHGLLFPSQNYRKKPMMCENTINNLLEKMGYKGRLVGHGFRALASTTLNERGFKPDVIERQLAHKERNAVRAAYNRAEYLDERRSMMQAWSDYIEAQGRAATVTKLGGVA